MRLRQDSISLGLILGYCADQMLGDPSRYHPVAGFGSAATVLERAVYRDQRSAGVLYTTIAVTSVTLLGTCTRLLPVPRWVTTAAATWVVLGGRSLQQEAAVMAQLIHQPDLEAARRRVSHLVGRDTRHLERDELARATVESVAENGSDAVVAPLFWGAVAGPVGLLTYRAINTLDAMVGHRTPRHEKFGWAAARLDDVANWLPARFTVVMTAVVTPSQASRIIRAVRRDAPAHPSPNAGPVEAAFAAALGRTLGGTNRYEGHIEARGLLGDGPPVTATDIPAAVTLQRRISLTTLAALVGCRLLIRAARSEHR